MSAPNYVTYTILLSSIAIIVAALAGLRVAVTRAGWEEAQRIATLRTAAVGCAQSLAAPIIDPLLAAAHQLPPAPLRRPARGEHLNEIKCACAGRDQTLARQG